MFWSFTWIRGRFGGFRFKRWRWRIRSERERGSRWYQLASTLTWYGRAQSAWSTPLNTTADVTLSWRHTQLIAPSVASLSISATFSPPQSHPSRIVYIVAGLGEERCAVIVFHDPDHITHKWLLFYNPLWIHPILRAGSPDHRKSRAAAHQRIGWSRGSWYRTMWSSHDSRATPNNEHAYRRPNPTTIRRNRHLEQGISPSHFLFYMYKKEWWWTLLAIFIFKISFVTTQSLSKSFTWDNLKMLCFQTAKTLFLECW